jgi:hypothetical protein
MESGRSESRSPGGSEAPEALFQLERFDWPEPDRLEITGRFFGLDPRWGDEPFLEVREGERVHRLTLLSEHRPDPPLEGGRWRAAFGWHEPPVPFDRADLHLGGGVELELPWTYGGMRSDARLRPRLSVEGELAAARATISRRPHQADRLREAKGAHGFRGGGR